jgi:hypothetical protein
MLRLALTGGTMTIRPAPHTSAAEPLIEVRLDIPDGAGACHSAARILCCGELRGDDHNLLGSELWAVLNGLATDRFLESLPW